MKIVLQMGILPRNYHFQASSHFEKSNPDKVRCIGIPQTVFLWFFVGDKRDTTGEPQSQFISAFTKKSVFLVLPDWQVQQNTDFMKGRKAFSAIPTVLFLTIPVFLIGFRALSLSKTSLFVNDSRYKSPFRFAFRLPWEILTFHSPNLSTIRLFKPVFIHNIEPAAILPQNGYRRMDVSLLIKQTV